MPLTGTPIPAALEQPGVRLRTLTTIRWMAIGGQGLTFLIVGFGLGFALPYVAGALALAAAVILNLGLLSLYPRNARLVGMEALAHLAFDLVQLGVLLYLTGGINNPFSILMIVPVTVSATLLTARATVGLMGIAIGILVLLWPLAHPLPWDGPPPEMPLTYEVASFAALAFCILFIAGYVLIVSRQARRWQEALVVTQAVLDRETKMSALGALAAAAAHELGGPLGTITLIAKDMNRALADDPEFGGDAALLMAEAERCRAILRELSVRAEAESPFPTLSIRTMLRDLAEVADGSPGAKVVVASGPADAVEIAASPELRHGLLNLIDNARRHARGEVTLAATKDTDRVAIHVEDDGPGFPEDLLPMLGEPYLGPTHSRVGGTGLGVFIATSLLERTGANVRFRNSRAGGARVEVSWLAPGGAAEEEEEQDDGGTAEQA